MTGRADWKRLCVALRCLGGVAAVGAAALGIPCAAAVGFRFEDGMGPVREAGILLLGWLLAMAAMALLAVPLTRRAMNTDGWREALSWTAASFWQGARVGMVVALALGALALLAMGLWA